MAALAAAGALAFAGCGSSDKNSGSSASSSAAPSPRAAASKKTVCAIMPDADSSSRWVHNDAPTLTKQFEAAGFKIKIQNAENDTQKYATIAQQDADVGLQPDGADRPQRRGHPGHPAGP